MKKITILFAALMCAMAGFSAEEVLFTQTFPGTPSSYTSAYTKSFTLTTDGYTLTYANINNGNQNDGWTAVRAGSKNGASVATITSGEIEATVSKVVVNLTQVATGNVNSMKLYVASNSSFTSDVQTINADKIAVGNVTFAVTAPAANQFYKVEMDLSKASANGFVRFDKVEFYKGEAANPDAPFIKADDYDFGTLTLEDNEVSANYTLPVSSGNLGSGIKVSVMDVDGGPSNYFTADKDSLHYDLDRVTITFKASEVGEYTATLNLTSGNTYKNVNLKAVVVAPTVEKDVYTVAEVVAEYDNITIPSEKDYTVEGYITKLQYTTYGNNGAAFWIADEKGGAQNLFEIYQLTAEDEDSKVYGIGDKIRATGKLNKYNSTKEMTNGTYKIIEKDTPAEDKGATTIANFLQLKDTKNTYHLTGVVANIANTTYGNFDLVDGNDTIYIYGLLTAEGVSKKFESMNIEEGDTLELKGVYTTHNNAPQIANAIFVSLKKASGDTPSALENVEALDVKAPMYNVLGIKVDEQYKGVVIQNGKKYLLK
ncbi:MAG: hypothetical protein IJ776_07485 [Paludibacteraceae bacterium]|nr:hypothetical protein [Paludibacteraceae bacterium]